MPDAHLAEHLDCYQPSLQVALGESARPQHPRSKDEQGREELGERGRGLVVSGDAQVGINLGKEGCGQSHTYTWQAPGGLGTELLPWR